MHEASIAGGVLQMLEGVQARESFRRLRQVRIAVGQLAGVDLRALRFALEALAPGTCLDGAELILEEPPGQAWCLGCGQTVALARRGDPCPVCSDYRLQPTGGTELQVIDLLVDDEDN